MKIYKVCAALAMLCIYCINITAMEKKKIKKRYNLKITIVPKRFSSDAIYESPSPTSPKLMRIWSPNRKNHLVSPKKQKAPKLLSKTYSQLLILLSLKKNKKHRSLGIIGQASSFDMSPREKNPYIISPGAFGRQVVKLYKQEPKN